MLFLDGRSLPVECNPTSSSPGKGGKPAPKKSRTKSHVPSKQGLRTRETISKLVESADKDDYHPRRAGMSSELKTLCVYRTQFHTESGPLQFCPPLNPPSPFVQALTWPKRRLDCRM
jgi:hypothetical protein